MLPTHVDVAPFSEEYKPIKKIPIGSCATAWTSPTSGQVYIIVFHQALYFGNKLKNSLICPNQVRDCNFNSVEEIPRQFDARSKHGITIQTPMEDDDPKKVFIKLSMRNVISYFPTRKPTRLELDECQHLIATNDTPWDPHSLKFRMAELPIDNDANISSTQRKDQFLFDDREFDFTEAPENKSKQIPSLQEIDNTLERRSLDRRNQWGPSVTTIEGPNKVDCERLAKTWNISFKKAEQTLKFTTQKALRNLQLPLMKLFIPIQNKSQAHQGLKIFIHEVGIPEHLISDGAPEQGSPRTYKTHWNSIVKRNHIHQTFIQPHCPFQNRAQQAICHLGNAIITKTAKKKSPRRLWSFCGELCASIRQRTASSNPSSIGRTPFELVHGYRPDITLYTSSEWYDSIFHFDKGDSSTHGVERLGRWLGPCGSKVGGGDCFWILTESAIPISTKSIRLVKEFEWRDQDVLRRMEAIDKSIESKIGDEVKDSASFFQENYPEPPEELFDEQPVRSSDLKLEMAEPEASVEDIDEYDEYLGNKVIIERNDERLRRIVKDRVIIFLLNPIR
eukprot:jgi/Psemu1/210121/e_gw1.523.55.1